MENSYRQTYHACVPSGWSNDPNGMIYYNGEYHLFYQHYPYKTQWGIMHWGHFTSKDMVKWENQPVALTPDEEYEAVCGCCSGSAIELDGKMVLIYTAAQPDLQRQCLAWSEDGIHFTKDPANPILRADDLHPEVSIKDFRDPFVFRKNGHFYMLAGAKLLDPPYKYSVRPGTGSWGAGATNLDPTDINPSNPPFASGAGLDSGDGFGNLVLCRSDDLYHWSYIGRLVRRVDNLPEQFYQLLGAYECPSYFELDGTEVVLSSPQNFVGEGKSYQNVHASTYMTGKLNFDTGHFSIDSMGEVDYGFDFYAEQAMNTPDGRVVMIAWKEMWDRAFPTQSEGWAGTYTLPRELHIKDGKLVQQPVAALKNYRTNPVTCKDFSVSDGAVQREGVEGSTIELNLMLKPGTARKSGVKLFQGTHHETLVYYDAAEGVMVFDRTRSGKDTGGRDRDKYRRYCPVEDASSIQLQCYLDVSSVEVFVDGGLAVMTGNVFPDFDEIGVSFFAEGGEAVFEQVEKFDLMVK